MQNPQQPDLFAFPTKTQYQGKIMQSDFNTLSAPTPKLTEKHGESNYSILSMLIKSVLLLKASEWDQEKSLPKKAINAWLIIVSSVDQDLMHLLIDANESPGEAWNILRDRYMGSCLSPYVSHLRDIADQGLRTHFSKTKCLILDDDDNVILKGTRNGGL